MIVHFVFGSFLSAVFYQLDPPPSYGGYSHYALEQYSFQQNMLALARM